MTQPDETFGQPVPAQPTEPVQPTQPTESAQPTEPVQPAQAAEPVQPTEPAPFGSEPPAAPTAEAGYAFAPAGGFPVADPAEQAAAAAAKKARRRGIFVKSAVLTVPALVLVALLAATGVEANHLTTKTTAASTAAKAANVADALAGQLQAVQSAAEASILVDAGCVAVESQATDKLENKLLTDGSALDKAAGGNSLSAYAAAVNHYTNDLQTLSTDLQQDAALSKRSSVTSAVGALTGDLKVVISSMQDMLGGDFSNSLMSNFESAANRMEGDATAVDTLCGGSTLNGTSGAGSSLGGGNLSA
jgi:hypothetical protein